MEYTSLTKDLPAKRNKAGLRPASFCELQLRAIMDLRVLPCTYTLPHSDPQLRTSETLLDSWVWLDATEARRKGSLSYRPRMRMLYCVAVLSQYSHPQPSRLSFLKTTGVKSLSKILSTRPVPL